jgi:hypothetical protein
MNSIRKSPVVNLLSLLVFGATVTVASAGVSANERRDGTTAVSMSDLSGTARGGLRELSMDTFVLDKHLAESGAAEASPGEVEVLAPYLEMHGRAEAGVRPVILPWSVRMESVN